MIEELQAQAGRRYDARVVKACAKLLRERRTEHSASRPVSVSRRRTFSFFLPEEGRFFPAGSAMCRKGKRPDATRVLRSGRRGRRLLPYLVSVVFSGDVGQYDSPILRDPQTDPGVPVDIALMESTYGDRRHRERADRHDLGSPADVRG